MERFLEGVRVVEIGHGAALAYAGLLLVDSGADVIKVEPPEGDPSRTELPLSGGTGAVFAALNRGKKSVQTAPGDALLDSLLHQADAVVTNCLPDERPALEQELKRHAGKFVHCEITAFGAHGPLAEVPGSELVAQAMSNFTAPLGTFGEEPVRAGADVAELNTGLYAAIGLMGGLLERLATRQGSRLGVSMLGTLLQMRSLSWAAQTNPDDWTGFHLEGQYQPPATAYKTADGQAYFTLHRGTSEDWDRLLIGLDMIDVMDDPRFGDYGRGATGTAATDPFVKQRFEQAFAQKTTAELLELLHSVQSNAVAFNDYDHLFATDHVKQVGLGRLRMSNGQQTLAGAWMGDYEPSQEEMGSLLHVPALGEHTQQIRRELGLD